MRCHLYWVCSCNVAQVPRASIAAQGSQSGSTSFWHPQTVLATLSPTWGVKVRTHYTCGATLSPTWGVKVHTTHVVPQSTNSVCFVSVCLLYVKSDHLEPLFSHYLATCGAFRRRGQGLLATYVFLPSPRNLPSLASFASS